MTPHGALLASTGPCALFGSTTPPGSLSRLSLLARDPRAIFVLRDGQMVLVTADGVHYPTGNPWTVLRELLSKIPPGSWPDEGGLACVLAYDLARPARPHEAGAPLLMALAVDRFLVFEDGERVGGRPASPPPLPSIPTAAVRLVEGGRSFPTGAIQLPEWSSYEREHYRGLVRCVKEHIAAGDIYQANLSQRFRLPWPKNGLRLYGHLRRISPAPFSGYFRAAGLEIVSASPERLLRVEAGCASTRPIAGTRPRSSDPSRDQALARELLLSEKERAEHLMLVDLARNDLGKVAALGSVTVDELMVVEDYSHVRHIVSNVSARLAPGRDALDALLALFPGGTITGVPKRRCMEILDELEEVPRGFYTGSLFYLTTSGVLDANILIRSAVVTEGSVTFHTGGGIVADSIRTASTKRLSTRPRAFDWPCRPPSPRTDMKTLNCCLLAVSLVSAKPAPPVVRGPVLEAAALMPLKPRSIGPAVMGGRVSEVALDPKDPFTFYVALATGGLLKTSNNGGTFKAVFEKEAVASVGAVAVSPSDPSVVWVGTGEANDRNSSGWGAGVYRSTDRGASWTQVGLGQSRAIARIIVHPSDPATAWVAAMGDLWMPGPERGLYKTTDAGKTWRAVLTAPPPYGDRVGCGDVALDPGDPNVLYAALYARRRTPWSFAAGPDATDQKDLGGIFKSTDGGETWQKLTQGLPAGTGRIGLSIHAKNPRIVYAVVQSDEGGGVPLREVRSKRGGVFRSEDAGLTWTRTSPLNPRPFYFSQIRVDPENDKKVYVLGLAVHVSEDGGRTFREDRFDKVHPDCHALAVDPRNNKRLVLGTDGGVYQSHDGGEAWEHMNRTAAGEYYRISVDMSTPYRICGGLQDNRNWVGPSATRTKDGILNSDWTNLGGGDGFSCVFDPEDPDAIYFESQGGALQRISLRTGEPRSLRPAPSEGKPEFRFHWNAPLLGSRHEKGALYFGGNRVFKLTARGEEWKAVGPDLSAQDPLKTTAVGSGAETYGVVYTLAESPLKAGLLWAGTDDGKVWTTENGGEGWTDLTAHLPSAVKGQWITRIDVSAHDAAVAYLAVDAHRSGQFGPLVYRTADGGRSWELIAGNLPSHGPVKVIREDPSNPNLLFAGTEFGLFVSLDRGGHWTKWPEFPTVAVDDLVIHPRERDLVIATHGRSLFVVDDIRPLEELTAEIAAAPAHLFAPRPALGLYPLPGIADWAGGAIFKGTNPPEGAMLSFHVGEQTGEPVKIEIENSVGQPVAKLTAAGMAGFGRIAWDLKPSKELLTEYGGEGQKFVPSGEYTVTLKYGKTKVRQKLEVRIAEGIETR